MYGKYLYIMLGQKSPPTGKTAQICKRFGGQLLKEIMKKSCPNMNLI